MYLARRIISALIVLFFTGVQLASGQQFTVKKVVLDAGHGGHDTGCLGHSHSREKDVTLAIALDLGKLIEKNLPGVEVIYTRKTDVFVELKERAAIANRARADLFISIHCNASSSKEAYGTETYFLGLHKTEANLEVAKRENSVIKLEDNYKEAYNGFDANSPEWHIAMAMNVSAFMEQSSLIAQKVQDQFTNNLNRYDRGVKQAGFLVLHQTSMPAILIETGFLTNPQEDKYLTSWSGQRAISKAIFNAFVKYKGEIEKTKLDIQLFYDEPGDIEERPAKPVLVSNPAPPGDKAPPPNTMMINGRRIWEIKDILPKKSTGFFVQLLACTELSAAQTAKLKGVELLCTEPLPNGIRRYLAGPVFTQNEALNLKKEMLKLGFSDAFLAVYQFGERLHPDEAKKYLTAN